MHKRCCTTPLSQPPAKRPRLDQPYSVPSSVVVIDDSSTVQIQNTDDSDPELHAAIALSLEGACTPQNKDVKHEEHFMWQNNSENDPELQQALLLSLQNKSKQQSQSQSHTIDPENQEPAQKHIDWFSGESVFPNKLAHVSETGNANAKSFDEIITCEGRLPEKAVLTGLLLKSLFDLRKAGFMVDIPWLTHKFGRTHLTVISGDSPGEFHIAPTLTVIHPPLMQTGNFHAKLMILVFNSCKRLRIVISSANLTAADWDLVGQVIWVQDFPEHTCSISPLFKDLSTFLRHCTVQQPLIDSVLGNFDLSSAKGFLISSVPGFHKGEALSEFGHRRLCQVVSDNFPATSGEIYVMTSSLGMLQKWWVLQFSASAQGKQKVSSTTNFHVLFPTKDTVVNATSIGFTGADIFYQSADFCKELLRYYLRGLPALNKTRDTKWANSAREPALSHIKAIVWRNGTDTSIYVGSHNLTMSSWGSLRDSGSTLYIAHFELGILLPRCTDKNLALCEIPAPAYKPGQEPWMNNME